MKYYINYNSLEDEKPHYGSYDSETQVMDTGKRYTKLYETEIIQEAKDFLFEKFGLEWEIPEIEIDL